MGASLSLAVFAALVAAITVVASMTVIAAIGLLFYSSVRGDGDDELGPEPLDEPSVARSPWDTPMDPAAHRAHDPGTLDPELQQQTQPVSQIDVRNLLMYEEDPSISRQTDNASIPTAPRSPAMSDAAFGTPEWTEEEGATEIFSAHQVGDLQEFVFIEDVRTGRQLARDR